jgi:hypothetical protein
MLNEILTNTNWLEPQINFLVWLQNVRVLTGGILDKFFLSLTTFGELFLPTVIMCLVYWCVDTRERYTAEGLKYAKCVVEVHAPVRLK